MLLRFSHKNKKLFEYLQKGTKKVETRAATKMYKKIKIGDVISFSCDDSVFERKISKIKYFKTVVALLKVYKPQDINPKLKTKDEIANMYDSFTGYKEKIKEFGILAFELK